MTVAEALEHYGSHLTDYEKKEISSYSEIWFLGLNASKIRGDGGGNGNSCINHGYDDENGNYNKVSVVKFSHRDTSSFVYEYV